MMHELRSLIERRFPGALLARFLRPMSLACVLIGALSQLVACSPYQLQGKVIQGDISFVTIVDADDPRLQSPGVAGALLRLELDPDRLNRSVVGDAVSGPDGEFSIPFRKVGAGVLLYDVELRARRGGYDPTESAFRLPSSGKRVLVFLKVGVDDAVWKSDNELMQQYERFR